MMRMITLIAALTVLSAPLHAAQGANKVFVKMIVQGDSPSLPDFLESLRRDCTDRGITLTLVDRASEFDYNIILAQESTIGSAAAAVVVLDRTATFVTSVVRSGRLSGKGAFNASAKELAKKIAILRGLQIK